MQAREGLQASVRYGRERRQSSSSSLVLCIDSKVGMNMLETFDVDFDGVTETTSKGEIAREVVMKMLNLGGAIVEEDQNVCSSGCCCVSHRWRAWKMYL
jgi:hypothetical protein